MGSSRFFAHGAAAVAVRDLFDNAAIACDIACHDSISQSPEVGGFVTNHRSTKSSIKLCAKTRLEGHLAHFKLRATRFDVTCAFASDLCDLVASVGHRHLRPLRYCGFWRAERYWGPLHCCDPSKRNSLFRNLGTILMRLYLLVTHHLILSYLNHLRPKPSKRSFDMFVAELYKLSF